MKKTIYVDGKFTDAERATVSVFDRGLNYGDGFFETMKAYDGRVFRLAEHALRMKEAARELSIRSKLLTEISKKNGAINELLKRNKLVKHTAYVKIIVTRGTGGEGHLPGCSRRNPPTVIITARAVNEGRLKRLQSRGVSAVLVDSHSRTNARVKSLNFLPSVLGKLEAKRKNVYEALFTDKKKILEGSGSNIFIVKKNTLVTPPDDGSILPGITRGEVLRLAELDGLSIKEAPISRSALMEADEAFITNSMIEITPLVKVNSSPIAGVSPGRVTRRLQKLYREETERK